jgi:hypothetical protein
MILKQFISINYFENNNLYDFLSKCWLHVACLCSKFTIRHWLQQKYFDHDQQHNWNVSLSWHYIISLTSLHSHTISNTVICTTVFIKSVSVTYVLDEVIKIWLELCWLKDIHKRFYSLKIIFADKLTFLFLNLKSTLKTSYMLVRVCGWHIYDCFAIQFKDTDFVPLLW